MVRDAEDLGAFVRGNKVGMGVKAGIVVILTSTSAGHTAGSFGGGHGFAGVRLGWGEGFCRKGVLFAGVGCELDGQGAVFPADDASIGLKL